MKRNYIVVNNLAASPEVFNRLLFYNGMKESQKLIPLEWKLLY